MKILCLTDIHGEKKKLSLLLEQEQDADLVLVAGDITHRGGYSEALAIMASLLDSDTPVYAVHGNMDKEGVNSLLQEKEIFIHGQCIVYENAAIIGLGGSNPTPFGTPQEYIDSDVPGILGNALNILAGKNIKILVSHAPPFDTRLDIAGNAGHVGSAAVRDIITTYDIDLCICGHIHETGGTDTIGTSICVNPGPLMKGNYAIVEISGDRIKVTRRKI
jgi:uncharacterized protein